MNGAKKIFLMLAILLAAAPAFAQSVTSLVPEVQEKSYGRTPYITGGVGLEERAALEERMGDYNLKLIFALEEGNYLSSVDVTIRDDRGNTVLQTTTNGPWLAARLPEGSYTVRATIQGETQEKTVEVRGARLEEVAVLY
jgi:hypothetical protein